MLTLLYITTADEKEATHIARTLLEEKLIACANIFPAVTSLYHWEGKRCETAETVMIAKTHSALQEKAIARARNLHSYECPCIVVLPISGGYGPFLAWVEAEVQPASA